MKGGEEVLKGLCEKMDVVGQVEKNRRRQNMEEI